MPYLNTTIRRLLQAGEAACKPGCLFLQSGQTILLVHNTFISEEDILFC
jgi:hypothetical protein